MPSPALPKAFNGPERGGAKEVVHSISELPFIDGVIVAVPTIDHGEVIEELLSRNIPIFVEKPITVDPEQAWDLAKRAADRLFVMDKWRYHSGIQRLAKMARSEEYGPVLGLQTNRIGWGNLHDDVDGIWYLTPHSLSIALEILGNVPQPKLAVAEVINGFPTSLLGCLGSDPWVHIQISTRSPAFL